jgi:hypothetical protein
MCICPLCTRSEIPEDLMQRHHLKTKRKDKEAIGLICRECHKQIHGLFTNTQLRDDRLDLNTLEGLLENPDFQKALVFIRKQKPGSHMKIKESRTKKRG